MTEAVAQILAEIQRLPPPDRADLADNIVETLVESIPPEVERAQLARRGLTPRDKLRGLDLES